MLAKNKQIIELKKLLKEQKKIYKIGESFSYRFDHRTGKLILSYSIPILVKDDGKIKTLKKKKEKYRSNIDVKNWRKFFQGDRTIVRDDAKFVESEIEKAQTKQGVGDEYGFRWWLETYYSRTVGLTKTIKTLSPLTIKQNKNHLNQYYDWCILNDQNSEDIFTHADNGKEWYEKYYKYKLSEGKWSPATIGISFRNVRGFYNFVADRHKDNFPFDILKRLKIPTAQNKRDMLNTSEYDKVLDFMIQNKTHEFWGKFILMLRLQLKTGMRVSEVVNIRNRNIDIDTKQIHITGKGEKNRVLNFSNASDEDIWKLIVNKMSAGIFLFYRTRIQKYPKLKKTIEIDVDKNLATTSSYYLQRFREMRVQLGLREIITSHSLRRYFITKFVKGTGNRDLVRQIVGHSSTRMVDYYMGSMIEPDTTTTIDIGI